MKDFILSCSSTADLTKEHFVKRDISYICFHFELDGKQYKGAIFHDSYGTFLESL